MADVWFAKDQAIAGGTTHALNDVTGNIASATDPAASMASHTAAPTLGVQADELLP